MSLVELGGGSTGFERDLLCVVVSMSVGGGWGSGGGTDSEHGRHLC